MKTIRVVAAVIEKDGKIFATQHGYGDYKDWWEFPGGKIEAGEVPEDALAREIREELKAEIKVGDLFYTVEYHLFISPKAHSKGIGYAAWCAVERMHPEVKVWETVTPYFETRNIHFYVNRCGFRIVEFFCSHHPDPNESDDEEQGGEGNMDGMFRFEKVIGP